MDPAAEALQLALLNMKQHFAFVGLSENLPSTMRQLEALLPDYFEGTHAAFDGHSRGVYAAATERPPYYYSPKFGLQNRNPSNTGPVSTDTGRYIGRLNRYDLEFYAHVEARFYGR